MEFFILQTSDHIKIHKVWQDGVVDKVVSIATHISLRTLVQILLGARVVTHKPVHTNVIRYLALLCAVSRQNKFPHIVVWQTNR